MKTIAGRKLKYLDYLRKFPDCPCATEYKEVTMDAYRWEKDPMDETAFLPLNIIKTPPQRVLDENDLMCKGYGLSMFSSLALAAAKYRKLIDKFRSAERERKQEEYGSKIALLGLDKEDGLKGDHHSSSGHFTFHEYEGVDLQSKTNI
ncbi:hypothetical protein [Sphingobacterium bambusae]|uniref:Uncharacterized protein n=1 Tax=Sphingobacterium bambusae TaxID=662858 RepID=A0ABW6BKD0_9SPHI|nr:hypothetical protein [Sphingobacterium bambusae]WPL47899.1 hypothetical protein SCB77_18275 [Sphingobacterium bambusae]